MKTSDEFIEELKSFVRKNSMKANYPFESDVIYVNDIIDLIEQFEAEQKRVNHERT